MCLRGSSRLLNDLRILGVKSGRAFGVHTRRNMCQVAESSMARMETEPEGKCMPSNFDGADADRGTLYEILRGHLRVRTVAICISHIDP